MTDNDIQEQPLPDESGVEILVPLTDIYPRGNRQRLQITTTKNTVELANSILSDGERSSAFELGLRFVLYMKSNERFSEEEITQELCRAFGHTSVLEKLDVIQDYIIENYGYGF